MSHVNLKGMTSFKKQLGQTTYCEDFEIPVPGMNLFENLNLSVALSIQTLLY